MFLFFFFLRASIRPLRIALSSKKSPLLHLFKPSPHQTLETTGLFIAPRALSVLECDRIGIDWLAVSNMHLPFIFIFSLCSLKLLQCVPWLVYPVTFRRTLTGFQLLVITGETLTNSFLCGHRVSDQLGRNLNVIAGFHRFPNLCLVL